MIVLVQFTKVLHWGKPMSEKAMAPHSSTFAWKIPWVEEPGRLKSMGSLGVGHDWVASLSRIGEGNGNPLQCPCLENPRDGGAWWAAIYGVTQSRTLLKRLSSSSSSKPMQVDVRDSDLISGSGRSPGGGRGNPLQYSCLEHPIDRGAWPATVHRVTKSQTQLKLLNMHTCTLKSHHNKHFSW